MGFELVLKGNRTCPVVFCDGCSVEVSNAEEAMYAWVVFLREGPFEMDSRWPLRVFHKGSCLNNFESEAKEYGLFMTMELRVLPAYLAGNLGMDFPVLPVDPDGDVVEGDTQRVLNSDSTRQDPSLLQFAASEMAKRGGSGN